MTHLFKSLQLDVCSVISSENTLWLFSLIIKLSFYSIFTFTFSFNYFMFSTDSLGMCTFLMSQTLRYLSWCPLTDRMSESKLLWLSSTLTLCFQASSKLHPSTRGFIIVKNWTMFFCFEGILAMYVSMESILGSYLLNSILTLLDFTVSSFLSRVFLPIVLASNDWLIDYDFCWSTIWRAELCPESI